MVMREKENREIKRKIVLSPRGTRALPLLLTTMSLPSAWRLLLPAEWAAAQAAAAYAGSPLDTRDGFLHMSPAHAVRETASLYFADAPELTLLRVDLSLLSRTRVRHDWVPSRAVAFPHLLAEADGSIRLPISAVVEVSTLTATGKGEFVGFPSSLAAEEAAAPLDLLFIGQKNYSSWSLRPWLLMRHLRVPFAECFTRVAGRGFSSEIVASTSPSGLVPLLRAGNGDTVWDSLAIAEYLHEAHPGKVWPSDATARAFARCVSAEMHSGFGELRSAMPMNIKMRRPRAAGPLPLSSRVADDIARICAIWVEARTRWGVPSNAGPWLFGSFTASDAMYAPIAWRFKSYGVRPTEPLAAAYVATLLADEHMLEWEESALREEGEGKALGHYDAAAAAAGCVPRLAVEVVDFAPCDAVAFRELNEAWIKAHFVLEAHDIATLSDPSALVASGGRILVALDTSVSERRVLGVCALLQPPADTSRGPGMELAKMGVAEDARGKGVGRKLLEAAISLARSLRVPRIDVLSNRKLSVALALYASVGFVELPLPANDYARADIYMEVKL